MNTIWCMILSILLLSCEHDQEDSIPIQKSNHRGEVFIITTNEAVDKKLGRFDLSIKIDGHVCTASHFPQGPTKVATRTFVNGQSSLLFDQWFYVKDCPSSLGRTMIHRALREEFDRYLKEHP